MSNPQLARLPNARCIDHGLARICVVIGKVPCIEQNLLIRFLVFFTTLFEGSYLGFNPTGRHHNDLHPADTELFKPVN